jgi:hypothetical protein
VARLAIGKGFLAEYGRLDKDVRRAVDEAIATFAKHPHPGSRLEKPQHGWDDRLRTLKVNSHWQGVVLAPATGDTYCLITILPRDKAKAYATSRRFSANPALGVLEVRDEEAIKQSQPLLAEAVRPDGKRLFADVSDADLTRLGVDAQILPMIRLMTSEADLGTRQAALPEAQYAALHALACGMTVDEARKEVARLYSADAPPEQVDPDDLVSAMERSPSQVTFVSGHEELQLILAHPFAAWRLFLHPSQRKIAYRASYSGPAQVTGGPGTGKTVTLLHRAAFLATRAVTSPASGPGAEGRSRQREPGTWQVLVTTFNGTLADALAAQLDLLVKDDFVRRQIEVLNVDRLTYRIVKAARGAPVIADERALRAQWAEAAAAVGLDFPPAFLKNEWEQVILAQDLRTEQAYLTCLRTGRGRPLTKVQRSQVWQAAQQVTAELAAAGQSTHLQLANEAAHLLGQTGAPGYRHILVDEAQDLHPSQWRLLRAAVAPGPDDLFIVADPHQRIYDNRVSLVSMRISVRGRTQRLSLNYRTTQEVLAWALPLLGTDPVTGLDGEADSLLGYRSPMHGPRPQLRIAATRSEEFSRLAEQIRSWLAAGIEPQAIGVTARSASLVREARETLRAEGIMTIPLSGRSGAQAVRAGTMHAMKGLEFQAVAVIGVERGVVPEPATITPESEDPVAYAQDLQRERCLLFVACTRARDHLYVSGTGEASTFLPARDPDPPPSLQGSDALTFPEESPGTLPAPPPKLGMRELLWSYEDSWRPRLRSVSLIAEAELPPEHTRQVAAALGQLYASLRHPRTEGDSLLSRWPACLVAAMGGAAATDNKGGGYWRALWKAACFQGTPEDEVIWGRAFNAAIGRLGMAVFPERPLHPAGSVLMHAGVPAHCLGGYLRVLLSRRRLDPAMDAESFLAWVTAAGRETCLSALDEPARQFLLNGGDYAHDFVDRTLDLLDRLTEPDPDFDAVRLPSPVTEAAKEELAAGKLDLSLTGRQRTGGQGAVTAGERGTPQVALAPYGAGVHLQPRLLLHDPLAGVTAPCGSPVYPVPPRLRLPQDRGASIRWYTEVRRVGGGASARCVAGQAGETDLWEGIPRPVLGAFEITVRGPLGRRMRRTVFVAEGLSVAYQPQVRPLTGAGLAAGTAELTAMNGATAQPAALRFGPREGTHVVEYRTDAASQQLVVTPPHVALLCPGAGVTTWTTSQIHLVSEDFASAGRLLIRVPSAGQPGQATVNSNRNRPELAVLVRGQRVAVIEASDLQSSGLAAFELTRAADTIAACGRADLAVDMGGALMPVGHVRPRHSAPGVESIFNGPCCSLLH